MRTTWTLTHTTYTTKKNTERNTKIPIPFYIQPFSVSMYFLKSNKTLQSIGTDSDCVYIVCCVCLCVCVCWWWRQIKQKRARKAERSRKPTLMYYGFCSTCWCSCCFCVWMCIVNGECVSVSLGYDIQMVFWCDALLFVPKVTLGWNYRIRVSIYWTQMTI